MQTSIPTFQNQLISVTDIGNEFEENEFEENEEVDDIDDIGNDSDYIPDPEPKKPRIFKENFPRWKWEKAYRYWIRQDDYSKPIIISREYVKTLGKQKRTEINVKSQFPNIVGDRLKRLRKWAEEIEDNGYGSARSVNLRVYEFFSEKRDKHGIVNDLQIRKWGIQAKNEINPNMKFKASRGWLLNFKRKYNIVSRSITHKMMAKTSGRTDWSQGSQIHWSSQEDHEGKELWASWSGQFRSIEIW